MRYLAQPKFRHVFVLRDGGTVYAEPNQVRKTLDKRMPGSPPERVFEVQINGLWRNLWPEDIIRWDQEEV